MCEKEPKEAGFGGVKADFGAVGGQEKVAAEGLRDDGSSLVTGSHTLFCTKIRVHLQRTIFWQACQDLVIPKKMI